MEAGVRQCLRPRASGVPGIGFAVWALRSLNTMYGHVFMCFELCFAGRTPNTLPRAIQRQRAAPLE